MNAKVYQVVDDFSLTSGGLFYKLVSSLRLGGISSKHITIRIMFLIAITWLPLLALTAIPGWLLVIKLTSPSGKILQSIPSFLLSCRCLFLQKVPSISS